MSMAHPRLLELINGYRTTSVIIAAWRLGLFERLGRAGADTATLARDLAIPAPNLRRLLRALHALGVTESDAQGRIALTDVGRDFVAAGSSLRDHVRLAAEEYAPAWADLAHSVRSGAPAFDAVFGMDVWTHRALHPDLGASFNRVMLDGHAGSASALCAAFDFSARRCLVDVGGGHGRLIADILAAQPDLRGVLFDLPPVIAGAGEVLRAAGVQGRCGLAAGSFFDAVPSGGDVYLLHHILHNWDDTHCVAILRQCRAAMGADGRLLIVEHLLPAEAAMPASVRLAMLDLHMLAVLGGQERSLAEFEALLRAGGLQLTRHLSLDASIHLLEAAPSVASNEA
jgi:hypothetical protein